MILIQCVPDRGIPPVTKDFGIGLIAYSPRPGGLLTSKYRENTDFAFPRLFAPTAP